MIRSLIHAIALVFQLLRGGITGGFRRVRIGRRTYWIAPIVAGGAPDGDDDGDDSDDDDGDDDDDDGESDSADDDDDDSEDDEEEDEDDEDRPAKKALRREREARKKAQAEAKKAKAEQKKLERRIARLENGGNDDLEQVQSENEELKEERDGLRTELQQAKLIAELADPKYELSSPKAAAKVIEVEFDDEGNPEDVEEAVEALLEEIPGMKRGATASGGSAANGSRSKKTKWTRERVQKLARDNPNKLNELMDKGEIPAEALGG